MHPIIALLILINFFGFLVGMIVYYQQMVVVNPIFWIFIPDCPLYVMLASIVYMKMFRNNLFKMITAAGLLKYGVWTIFTLSYYSDYFLSNWFGWLLMIEHIGMTFQFLLVTKKFEKKELFVAIGWFLLNDYVDYILGMHPYIPSSDWRAVGAFATAGSVLAPLIVYFIGEKLEKNSIMKALKQMLDI